MKNDITTSDFEKRLYEKSTVGSLAIYTALRQLFRNLERESRRLNIHMPWMYDGNFAAFEYLAYLIFHCRFQSDSRDLNTLSLLLHTEVIFIWSSIFGFDVVDFAILLEDRESFYRVFLDDAWWRLPWFYIVDAIVDLEIKQQSICFLMETNETISHIFRQHFKTKASLEENFDIDYIHRSSDIIEEFYDCLHLYRSSDSWDNLVHKNLNALSLSELSDATWTRLSVIKYLPYFLQRYFDYSEIDRLLVLKNTPRSLEIRIALKNLMARCKSISKSANTYRIWMYKWDYAILEYLLYIIITWMSSEKPQLKRKGEILYHTLNDVIQQSFNLKIEELHKLISNRELYYNMTKWAQEKFPDILWKSSFHFWFCEYLVEKNQQGNCIFYFNHNHADTQNIFYFIHNTSLCRWYFNKAFEEFYEELTWWTADSLFELVWESWVD
jgi:hypothetical protein